MSASSSELAPPLGGPSGGGALVEVRALTWRPFGRTRPVLERLDLRVEPGQRVLLAGPSGSGKSTLLRGLAGLLLTADSGELSGEVLVDGAPPQSRPGAVGLVLQDPGAGVVASSVGRDVAFGLENVSTPCDRMPAQVAAALAEVDLDLPLEAPPHTLSGGESQRLALAGALVMAPGLLLLDEPTAMLDPVSAATVRRTVEEVCRRRGLTLVVVEHRLDGWVGLTDRLVVLDARGAVVADGDPAVVLAERGDELTAQGIWVPGRADPEPLPVDLTPLDGVATGHVPSGEVVVSARGVTVEHRGARLGFDVRSVVAVRDTDLDVAAGESVALVGPSGAGKSSLMAAVGGLASPARGEVTLADGLSPDRDGRAATRGAGRGGAATADVNDWPSRDLARVVSWVPQRAATAVVGSTVRDDVLVTARALGLDAEQSARRADVLLQTLGLAHLAGVDPRLLSGGEQRRLALASAVLHGPALLLADEPTVGQDRLTWSAVTGLLDAARRGGAAVVVTTHDEGVVARADRTVRVERPAAPTAPDLPERRTLLAHAGPLALLVAALCVLPLPALLDSWRQGLAVLGVEVALGLVGLLAPRPRHRPSPSRGQLVSGEGRREVASRRGEVGEETRAPQGRLSGLARRLAPAGLAVVGVAWSAWLLGGRDLEVAAGAALRVLCLVVPSAFVLGYVDPDRLGDHLAQRVRLPARPVVAATAALQRLQSFDALWSELMTTRRVRGVRPDHGGRLSRVVGRGREAVVVTAGLLIGALGQAAALALAMDARGFADARRRTWAGAAPWRRADTVVVIGGLLVVATAVAARLLGL
ncbi:energy-coupling factor transport system ATP-binding protein [Terracoccus luteus]|uniref:Energy-coupling factor transport system ATP-binding protein n=1 Tax=Terracoccus luteus TaxID=53356 RepID=A0A495Y3Z8_9MICO|nr:ATP-binding cassette domain-containing protein [Terracoccus luteus]RKT80126.1 energy-coupling factor transport system ATP-binding protein [Terracoccus luteus]